MSKLRISAFRTFRKGEDGSATVEAVLWLPVLFMVFAMAVDAAFLFFGQNRALRVVQDANRMLSVGRLTSEVEVEDYVKEQLASLSPNLTVDTTIALGEVKTLLDLPSNDIMATGLVRPLIGGNVHVQASHLVEY